MSVDDLSKELLNMTLLSKSTKKWGRDRVLNRRKGGMKWSAKAANGRPINRAPSPMSENTNNKIIPLSNNNKGSSGTARSLITKGTSSPERNDKPLYISPHTISVIQTEIIENLLLPATLSNICLALASSNTVLDAYADQDNGLNTTSSDNNKMKSLEIMGTHLNPLSLSPTQKRINHKNEFREVCYSLVSGGNSIMLNSWNDVEEKLSCIFLFSKVDIEVPSNNNSKMGGGIPTSFNNRGKGGLKTTPKKVNRSPKRSRMIKPLASVAKKVNNVISISSYKQMMKKRMGESKFLQIFNHAEAITTTKKPAAIKSFDKFAKDIDDKIKQNEEIKRQDQIRIEKQLAEQKAKEEKEAKEREAKESAMKLMRPLTDEEQHIVDSAIHGIGPVAEILVRQDADSVQRGSMQTLQPNTWLNDEIINYFLKNCLAKRDEKLCAKQPGRKRSHFFNSFFVQTMFDEKNLNPNLRGKYNYKNVKRWGKKVPGKDVFNLRYIVCPINLDNMHWTSAVIFMELKKIQYFDSMGGTDRSKLEGLLQYLKDEHKAKKGTELDVSEWELVPCTIDTPRQRNGKFWDVCL